MEPLKVGLLGLGRGGQLLADALLTSSWSRLVAVGSQKPERLEQFAEAHPRIALCNDFRSLIVGQGIEALFVAVPPFTRSKYLPLAAERGVPVFMLTPPARSLEDAVTLSGRFTKARVPLVVSRAWGAEPHLQPDVLDLPRLGRVFFARGHVTTCWEEDFDWRGDSVRAGGGVLLDRAYDMVDQVVQFMGLPGTVYASSAGMSRPGHRFLYDTEDTIAVTCRFVDNAVAVFAGCWTSGPEEWQLDAHAMGGTVRIDQRAVRLLDRQGDNVLGMWSRPTNPLLPQVEEFLGAIRANSRPAHGRMDTHLAAMALISAAYLSARTGQPEGPASLMAMHDLEPPRSPGGGTDSTPRE